MRSFFISPTPATSTATLRFLLRWNSGRTAVVGTKVVREMRSLSSCSSSTRAFQLRLNPLTGVSEWIVVEEGDGRETEEGKEAEEKSNKFLLASTSYLDMLNDSYRNRAYRQAIEKTITKPCHALDIGAGTGLLSMMAVRAMEKHVGPIEGKVSACESYLPMGKLMRKVLRANGMEKRVIVFHKRSDELHVGLDLESPAEVLVSEILDSELLGEGLIPTLQQAYDMLLVEKPLTVPYRATTYGQLVESPFLWNLHDLYSSEANLSDGIHLAPSGLEMMIGIEPKQYAMHCDAISEELKILSDPFKIFEFDFWKRPESQGEIKMRIRATGDGQIHAVISWWVLQLDYEGSVFYSTAPKWAKHYTTPAMPGSLPDSRDWCDHWKQCVWFIPGSGMPVLKDKHVFFKANHDETKITYSLKLGNTDYSSYEKSLVLLPEKIAMYGDKNWRRAFIHPMTNALNSRASPLCLVADDSVFLTILTASLSKAANVISMFPGLKEKGAQYLNDVSGSNGFSMEQIKVLGSRASSLVKDCFIQRKVDLLVGEPFYYGFKGMLPWHNLRFWKERSVLDPLLSEDVVIMPNRGILRVCAMSLPDLWRSRCSLKEIEGFDHSLVNETLGACGNLPSAGEGPCLPFYIWQCGEVEILSEVISIMDFDFSKLIQECSGKAKIKFLKRGVCHALVLWIDWVVDESNAVIQSTGPDSRYWKQAVKILSNPVEINTTDCFVEIETHFDHLSGDVNVKTSFSAS